MSEYKAHPLRIQRRRTKGYKMPDGSIYVGRPTRFGNPWHHSTNMSSERCVNLYEMWIKGLIKVKGRQPPGMDEVVALRGKRLACWCPLTKPECHAEILCAMANS